MSIGLYFANLTKREWFSMGAFGGDDTWRSLGFNLASRAFELLILHQWSGDSLRIVGDVDPEWDRYQAEFADLRADIIMLIYRRDGFDRIGDAADRDERLFMQICHLVQTRQAPELEPHMKEKFGENFWKTYKEIHENRSFSPFVPKDLSGRP